MILTPRPCGSAYLHRSFFELTDPDEKKRRKELFVKNNLAITKHARFESEFGQYPVLYVDLSVSRSMGHSASGAYAGVHRKNVVASSMVDFLQKFKDHVSSIAQQLVRDGAFENLQDLHQLDRNFLDEVLTKRLADSDWSTALFELTRTLHVVHEKKVVLLVDEYDTPTSHAVQHGYFLQVCLLQN